MDRLDAALQGVLNDPDIGVADPDGPGAVVGLVADGELCGVAARGFANIEHGAPIRRDTVFHVASVSKQFTAFAVVTLASEGWLSLDDPVAKYLDWFRFGDITIRHLVHHASGLRDQWSLTFLSGRRMEDTITTEDVLSLVARQTELNFPPGSQYYYSNSGYTLLAAIVEAVTGRTLRDFCTERIFGPLGMATTGFVDDHHDIVARRADSYYRRADGEYGRIALSYSNAGATSLNTTVDDLAIWAQHVMTSKVHSLLEQDFTLTDGTKLSYRAGVIVEDYRGHRSVSHSGGDAGYRAHLLVLPEQKIAAIALANLADLPARRLARQAIDLLLADDDGSDAVEPSASANLDGVAGRYFDDDGEEVYELVVDDGQLGVRLGQDIVRLRASQPNRFTGNGLSLQVDSASDRIVVHPDNGTPRLCGRLDPHVAQPVDAGYVGTFHSGELDAIVHIELTADGSLQLRRSGWGTVELRPLRFDVFLARVPFLAGIGDAAVIVRFLAGGSQLQLGNPRARRVRFARLS